MTRRQFEALVEKALRKLPRQFKERLANIAVVVEDWADDETLAEMEIEPPDTLYGLYRGVDITRRDSMYGNVLPDTITIYQGPIEEDCADEADMAAMVLEWIRRHDAGWDRQLRDYLFREGSIVAREGAVEQGNGDGEKVNGTSSTGASIGSLRARR